MAEITTEVSNSMPAVIAVGVGNTRAKFGLFTTADRGYPHPQNLFACVLQQHPSLDIALVEWAQTLTVPLPETAVVAGSDPEARDKLLENWPLRHCTPRLVHQFTQLPVGVDVEFPERVGIDRLLNTFAAWKMAGVRSPVIAVDSGTATTVDLMTADGIFRGGSILPGLRLSAIALHDYTARLPLLNTDEERSDLPRLPGRNTLDAMRAGLFVGQLGAVRELCAGLIESSWSEYRQAMAPMLYITGGGGRQLAGHLPDACYVDSLALNGLAMLNLGDR